MMKTKHTTKTVLLLVFCSIIYSAIGTPAANTHTITHKQCRDYGTMQQFVSDGRISRQRAAKLCRMKARTHFLSHGLRLPPLLARIRSCESGNDYTAQNAHSTASGAWQWLDTTWSNHLGYRRAYLAPRRIQDAKAINDYRLYGTTPWVSSQNCWG